jgi:trans-aconitate methyltransferase
MKAEQLSESWKDATIFEKQLELNLKEFNSYPPHWVQCIQLIDHFSPKTILDIGCGVGSFSKVCNTHFPDIEYTGMDFSENSIRLAKENFGSEKFIVGDMRELKKEDIQKYDLLFLGAVFDVLPDGDKQLENILSLEVKSVLVSRMNITEEKSYYTEYMAYEELPTCSYHHNKQNFLDMCSEYDYSITPNGNNYYLKKNE